MDFKLVGGILLIVGTSIGAGMLALPIATANAGFLGSLILLIAGWFIMTAGAFLILEVNLWLPQNNNLISMARETIGFGGQLIAWITYLLLLYSLLCAYISGGSDLFHNLFAISGITFPLWVSASLFTLIASFIVYLGIRSVDYVNRGLMSIKLLTYFLLIGFLTPFVSIHYLSQINIYQIKGATALMVTMTSFGYATIIPSLRVYFKDDIKKLKIAILAGSLIPLICYILWDMVIMGMIPFSSVVKPGYLSVDNTTSEMINTLNTLTSNSIINLSTKIFTSICIVTSFLGVGLCLMDFLTDGLQIEQKNINPIFVYLLTFLPPFIIVLFSPNIFVKALSYAGVYCILLLVFLPAWMVWYGRYYKKFAYQFKVVGGRFLLGTLLLLSSLFVYIFI